MATAELEPPEVKIEEANTLADLLAQLGDVPTWRILAQPHPGSATEDDAVHALSRPRKRVCELIDGVLVEKAMSRQAVLLASLLVELLGAFVRPRQLGHALAADAVLQVWPGRLRIPGVCVIPWDHANAGRIRRGAFF